jgi:hypothetical protein
MTGSVLQLAANGLDNLYINQNPEITIFKWNYRRHTPFSKEEFDIIVANKTKLGSIHSIIMPPNGDLLHKTYLNILLPNVNPKYRNITVSEASKLLLDSNIIWQPATQSAQELLNRESYDEILSIIDQVNIQLSQRETDINTILNLLPVPTNNDTLQEYINRFYSQFIATTQFSIPYLFLIAESNDIQTETSLVNSIEIKDIILKKLFEYVTGASLPAFDQSSFNDENILFLFNLETANYFNNQNTARILFTTTLNNLYQDLSFQNLDAFKIFEKRLNENENNVNFDIDIVKNDLLNVIRSNLLSNPIKLNLVYSSLNTDNQLLYYRTANQSLWQNSGTLLNALSSSLFSNPQYYSDYVDKLTDDFDKKQKGNIRNISIQPYLSNINLISLLNLNANNWLQTELNNKYNTIPPGFSNTYLLNYIAFTTLTDIPIAITRYLNDIESSNISQFSSFLNALTILKNNLLTEISTILSRDVIFETQETLITNKSNPSDFLLTAAFNKTNIIEYNNIKYNLMQYIKVRYLELITSNNYNTQLDHIVNQFYTPINNLPTLQNYLLSQFNLGSGNYTINKNNLPILSNAISSIWNSLLSNLIIDYNDLYKNILDSEMFGSEMKLYTDTITANFSVNDNYWSYDDSNLLNINSYLSNINMTLQNQLTNYDTNKSFLDFVNVTLNRPNFFYQSFNITLTEYFNNISNPSNNTNIIAIENGLVNQFQSVIDLYTNTISSNYNNLINTTTNPFNITIAPNKHQLWIDIRTSAFVAAPQITLFNNLFNPLFTPQILFQDKQNIDQKYQGLSSNFEVLRYMTDQLLENTILEDVINFDSNTAFARFSDINNFYRDELNQISSREVKLNKLENTLMETLQAGSSANFAWKDKIGLKIIDYLELSLGDQIIDRQTGDSMFLYQQLYQKENKKLAYNKLIGSVPELTQINKNNKPEYLLRIPLEFWFCDNISGSVPMFALPHSNLKIKIALKKLKEVSFSDTLIKYDTIPKVNISLTSEYIYLAQMERKYMATNRLTYVITAWHFNGSEIFSEKDLEDDESIEANLNVFKQRLELDHNIKELFWTLKEIGNEDLVEDNISGASIEFFGRAREQLKQGNYYNYVKPLEAGLSSPDLGTYYYSFSIYPGNPQPSGSCNFSKIDDAFLINHLKPEVVAKIKSGIKYRLICYAKYYNILVIMSGMGATLF